MEQYLFTQRDTIVFDINRYNVEIQRAFLQMSDLAQFVACPPFY